MSTSLSSFSKNELLTKLEKKEKKLTNCTENC